MKRQIDLHQKTIEYTLRHSKRARYMRLAIYGDGQFLVTVPPNIDFGSVEAFLREKSRWIVQKLEQIENVAGKIFVRSGNKVYAEQKEAALALAQSRIAYFNEFYGFSFARVSIRNAKTRWGSCSKKGNLSFNHKISQLPAKLADYIIVHELCHLGEFNHSPKFWALVAKTTPNYRDLRRQLKKVRVVKSPSPLYKGGML